MKLKDILLPSYLNALENEFDFEVSNINIEFKSKDNLPGGSRAWISGYFVLLPVSNAKIFLDPYDFPLENGKVILTERSLETVYHELYHLKQYSRGIDSRLRIVWTRLTESDQNKRWHEVEARSSARKWSNNNYKRLSAI